ncbi:MAG: threonine synthase [Clostridiales Family XIII bacterium]|jgi:threonine synthase|nr:threonine synthase [Clostridiales Family XIII bacterium]
MIRYRSTRGNDETKRGTEAIIQGLAKDRGLFVPEAIPQLPFMPEKKSGTPYAYTAFHIVRSFLPDFSEEELERCIAGAYDSKFDAPEIAPLARTKKAWFLELYHGRTAAFKDMAMSLLPYLLTTAMNKEKEGKKVVILTATSGDTGKAALEGFSDVPGTEIVVFYPKDGVSQVQERQMVTQIGGNTHVFAIEGNFDDAQRGVKRIFGDGAFGRELASCGYRLSSANSINVGRLIPQIAYYVYAYVKLLEYGGLKAGEPMNVVVPTGNFGNILAAYYAKRMGLPIKKLICASNENRVLADFMQTGVYDANRDFHVTSSPSMDILVSSNLERLLYHLSGDSADRTAAMMEGLDADGRFSVDAEIREALGDFYGGSADMHETEAAIARLYNDEKYLIDTHTAVAYKVYEDYRDASGDDAPALITATASAFKFADSVARSIGLSVEGDGFANIRALHEASGAAIPDALRNLEGKEIRHTGVVSIDGMADAVRASLKGMK